MARHMEIEVRSGPRYLAAFEVRAEWDEPGGTHVLSEGITENVGPEGTLVHLPKRLPEVGSRVRLEVHGEDGHTLQVVAEVLRIFKIVIAGSSRKVAQTIVLRDRQLLLGGA